MLSNGNFKPDFEVKKARLSLHEKNMMPFSCQSANELAQI
jgi:hypothetical protein